MAYIGDADITAVNELADLSISATSTEIDALDMSASGSTSGQLLTSTGTGTEPTWQDAPQGVSNSKLFYFGSFI